ncbi:MAG: PAS domain S-box protein, partial [Janthinobacterium sp.]
MSDRIAAAAPSPGRLLAAAPEPGQAARALDLLSIIVAAVEQAPGMAVRGIDRDGIVRYWSAGAARLYGVPAELAVGQAWAGVAAALPQGQGGFDDGHAALAAVWDSGKARTARLWRLGTDGAAPRCIHSTVFPVMESGRVRQVVCVDIDITASGQDGAAQGALLLMGDNFRQLYDKSADAIVLLRDEYIAEANPAAIALFQCEDRPRLLGRRLSDFSPLRQPDGELSALRGTQLAALAHADGNCRYDWRYQTCLGELFWGEVLLTSVTLDHSYLFYAVIRDISSRKLAEQAWHLSAQVVEHAREAIVVMDPQQSVVSMNPAYSEISGYSPDDMLGKPFVPHGVEAEAPALFAHVWQEVDANGYWQGDIVAQRKGGERYPAWLSLTAIRDSQGQLSNYMAILSDISERKKHEEHTRHLAEHDFLTDLPNRVLLLDRLSLALAAARRKQSMLAILYLDLDHFKHINDSMGHHVGDLLLKEVARRLVRCVRGVDTVS